MTSARRVGANLVVESLESLGVDTVFGVPGQHALPIYHALAAAPLRFVGNRTELGSAFAADGYARASDRCGVTIVSTGPGALMTLPALQEARAASVPVVVITSQIPTAGLGGRRRGYLHELVDQRGIAAGVVKEAVTATATAQLPEAIRHAFESALSAPCGPVWVEVPVDRASEPVDQPPPELSVHPLRPAPDPGVILAAARRLEAAQRPVILAGGGVARAHAEAALLRLAEALRAPVATTFGGKGAFPREHPLSLQSWLEDIYLTEFLEQADVLLVVGSGLGELSSNYHTFDPHGTLIQIEADLGKLGANHDALGVHADADLALRALVEHVTRRAPDGVAEQRVADVLHAIDARLRAQDVGSERATLAAIRSALPDGTQSFWDMTVLGYWAWSAWDARAPRTMHSAQGSGGLGFALPAAIGAAAASGRRVLAVSGDGGAMYGLAELGTLRQHDLPVTWLIVDDNSYAILDEYMTAAFGETFATHMLEPDFCELAATFGIPAVQATEATLASQLQAAIEGEGPNVVVLRSAPHMFAATHLGRLTA